MRTRRPNYMRTRKLKLSNIICAPLDQNYMRTHRPKVMRMRRPNYMRTRKLKLSKIICVRADQNYMRTRRQNYMRTRRPNCMHMRRPKLHAHAHFISKCASHAECAFRFSLS